MGRKKQSGLETVMELTAACPWWVGVILAAGSYLLLHQFAVMDVARLGDPGQAAWVIGNPLVQGVASFFQYIFPLVFLGGAGLSVIDRWKRRSLHARVADRPDIDAVRAMNWQEFEMLVGEAFRQRGYQAVETAGGADGGVDLILSHGGEKYLVQCKHWKGSKVGVQVIRELKGVMSARGAKGGFVITSGGFTDEARAFANGQDIELIDGRGLVSMIGKVNRDRAGETLSKRQARKEPVIGHLAGEQAAAPACPKCDSLMVRRRATKGAKAGQEFWGCGRFPECWGSRPIVSGVAPR